MTTDVWRGLSLAPEDLGSIAPFGTKATRPTVSGVLITTTFVAKRLA